MAGAVPYWRLSGFYFFFFAVLGVLAPYWGPYLRHLGHSPEQIGGLIAILHATKLVAPNLWGWIADRSGRRMAVVRLATVAATVLFAGVLLGDGLLWLGLVMAAFSFFWHAALPQFEANTMRHLASEAHLYSRIRVWGSVGFIVAVMLLGDLTDRFGTGVVPWAALALFAALAAMSLYSPQAPSRPVDAAGGRFLAALRHPAVLGFFLACFLLKASHGPFYAFYSIYLEDAGYRSLTIGALWTVGVLAEIGAFLVMHRWLPRFGPRLLMVLAMAAGVLRWLLVGAFPEQLGVQAGAQLLHALTFGVYHAVAISLVNRYFVGPSQGRGQALYSSLTFGAGVALGSLLSGYLWEPLGAAATFYLAAAVALAGALVAWFSLPRRDQSPDSALGGEHDSGSRKAPT